MRLNQEGADKAEAGAAAAALAASGGGSANILPKSVSGYNIESNNISSSGSNYSFVSGKKYISSMASKPINIRWIRTGSQQH